jgi:gas vesicle protein
MKSHTQSHPPFGFAIGLAAGMFVGAGLAIWLAPRLASELRERITDSAKDIGRRASDHYENARHPFGEAVDALTDARAL